MSYPNLSLNSIAGDGTETPFSGNYLPLDVHEATGESRVPSPIVQSMESGSVKVPVEAVISKILKQGGHLHVLQNDANPHMWSTTKGDSECETKPGSGQYKNDDTYTINDEPQK